MRDHGTFLKNAIAMLVAVTIVACGGGGYGTSPQPIPQDDHTIAANPSLTFSPATLGVNAGETVTFAFGGVGHNVFFDAQTGAPSDIDGTNANLSVTRVFNTAGTYRYNCHIHPGMQGTVVVR